MNRRDAEAAKESNNGVVVRLARGICLTAYSTAVKIGAISTSDFPCNWKGTQVLRARAVNFVLGFLGGLRVSAVRFRA